MADDRPWWICHYGTVEFLIRAQTAEVAEWKVRTDQVGDGTTIYQLERAIEVRRGPVTVREATDDDKARWVETKGDRQAKRLA